MYVKIIHVKKLRFEGSKKMFKMKKPLVIAGSLALLLSSVETSFAAYSHELYSSIWTQGRSSVSYQVQSTFDATTKTQMQAAMNTWNSSLPTGTFFYKSATETSATQPAQNKINTITKNLYGANGSVGTHVPYINDTNGRIDESDIKINSSLTFANSPKAGAYDIQSVVTHELGHALRVGHSPVKDDTMYDKGTTGSDDMRTLTTADKEAAQVSMSRWRNTTLMSTEEATLNTDEQRSKGKTIVEAESLMVQFDKNELVNEADVIVSGTVLSQEVEKDFEGFPVTDTIIQVQTVYKGEPAETVEIRVDGGETDDMIYRLNEEAAPKFNIGEEVVVFLTSNKGSRPDKEDFGYYVVGQAQGKFNIGIQARGIVENNVNTQIFDINNIQSEIDQIEEYNEKNNIPKIFLPEGEGSDI